MSSRSLSRRRITPQQAKEFFKAAIAKRPQSVERLKQSLAISVGKYQRFMKYLKDSTELFHTSYFKDDVGIASKRKAKQKTKRGKEFKLQPNANITPNRQASTESPLFAPLHLGRSTSTRIKIPSRGETKTNKTQASEIIRKEETPTSVTAHFWKKVGKGSQKAHRRWKTDIDEKIGENTIGDLTRFDERGHSKAVNYLVLQLQLNIQDSKRCRIKTGVEEA